MAVSSDIPVSSRVPASSKQLVSSSLSAATVVEGARFRMTVDEPGPLDLRRRERKCRTPLGWGRSGASRGAAPLPLGRVEPTRD